MTIKKTKTLLRLVTLTPLLIVSFVAITTSSTGALPIPLTYVASSQCGSGNEVINTSIDFGCTGATCKTSNPSLPYCSGNHSALVDVLFALIRFITDGVGLIIIGSLIVAGIQYTFSRGEPQELKKATTRIQSTVIALIIFIFAYAFINYVIPNGFFGQ